VAFLCVVQQPGDRRARDPGLVLELEGRASRQRTAEHLVPAGLPGLARGIEREGLAGARRRPDDVDAVAAESQPTHDLGLVLADRRTRGQRRVDGGLAVYGRHVPRRSFSDWTSPSSTRSRSRVE
jgi:hypothetical protein